MKEVHRFLFYWFLITNTTKLSSTFQQHIEPRCPSEYI